jgi:dsRNA-specific ribonuclease
LGEQTSGEGSNRRDAEQDAADNMLKSLEVSN